jgi:putative flavoprotein involved in K+ transport
MPEHIDTVIIGGGQAGLAMSHCLTQHGREHVVLERGRVAERWRSERWDSLTLLTVNWLTQLPGYRYDGDDPDGFMSREALVGILDQYAARLKAPVRTGVEAMTLKAAPVSNRYLIETSDGTWEATHVVVATGGYQRGNVLPMSAGVPPNLLQLHSSQYRNPAQLPPGAVLVIGSGPSGCQICEELCASGRAVYLSIGRYERTLRRYRGKDRSWWNYTTGAFDRTVDEIMRAPSPYGHSGQLTGTRGGHNLDYRQFATDGVTLLGHLRGIHDRKLSIAPDLPETMALWDESLLVWKRQIDVYSHSAGLELPPDDAPPDPPDPPEVQEPILELDLADREIRSVIWATGFRSDFGWIQLPVFDGAGRPIHRRGVTPCPGVYFLGLQLLSKLKSSFIYGVGEDTEHVAEHMSRQGV